MSNDQFQHMTLAEAFPDYSEIVDEARKDLAFTVTMLWPECRGTTIRTLLDVASDAYVFGVDRNAKYGYLLEGILIPHRGKHRLDLAQEVILGRESLWACGFTAWSSLLVLVPNEEINLISVLKTCYGPQLVSNWRSGYSRSARRMQNSVAESSDNVAFCLQGIEYMDLVASASNIVSCLDYVAKNCKISKPDSWRYGEAT